MTCNLIQHVYTWCLPGLVTGLGAGNRKGDIRQGLCPWAGALAGTDVSAAKRQCAECHRRGVYRVPWSTEEGDRALARKSTFGIQPFCNQPFCKLGTACNALGVTGRPYRGVLNELILQQDSRYRLFFLAGGSICGFFLTGQKRGRWLRGLWTQAALVWIWLSLTTSRTFACLSLGFFSLLNGTHENTFSTEKINELMYAKPSARHGINNSPKSGYY